MEDNLFRSWAPFDALNLFDSKLEQVRCTRNPVIKMGRPLKEGEMVSG